MTTTEFALEFDIIYNSIASNAAQPVDAYEKSVFLTQAQEEIVKNYYNPKGNKYQEGFENTEKRRRDLEQLVKTASSTAWATSVENSVLFTQLTGGGFGRLRSTFFAIEDDVMFITSEQAGVISSDLCYHNSQVNIRPITQNELFANINNPFKIPDTFIWRLDVRKLTAVFDGMGNQQQTRRVVELANDGAKFIPREYKYRYIKYPKPIILEDLDSGLSINNISTRTECELNDSMHREILNRAVELALETSANPRTQTKVQLNERVE